MPIDTDTDDPAFPFDDETDEVALPRFEERLRARLGQAHDDHRAVRMTAVATTTARTAAPGLAPPDGDTGRPRVLRRPPPRRRRGRGRRSLRLGAGALAAAAALAAGVAAWPSGDGGGANIAVDDPAGTSVPPTSELAPLVIAAADEAAATSVVHITQDNTSYGDSEGWIDETTGAGRLLQYGGDGELQMDSSQQGDDTLTVDHCFAEYSEAPAGLPSVAHSATQWVQNYLADGLLVEDGTEVVGGRELLRLREVPYSELDPDSDFLRRLVERQEAAAEALAEARDATPPPSDQELALLEAEAALADARADAVDEAMSDDSGAEGELGVTLVDPDTYRPVIVRGYPGSDSAYTQTYEYLPRTPENLALLDAQVPEGFTEVTQLRGDGERADAGCH